MLQDLSWLAVMFCVYAFARLLHYACLRLEDNNKYLFLQKILFAFCCILWFVSAPVTIIMSIINLLHFRRLEDKVRTDLDDDPESHNYHKNSTIPLELIAVILFVAVLSLSFQLNNKSDEIDSLKASLEEAYDEYDNGYEAGADDAKTYYYSAGYDDGFEAGAEAGYEDAYNDGFADGYAEGLDE